MQERSDEQRCPVCGEGVFTDVVYEDPEPGRPQPRLAGDSYEVLVFSCGHEAKGAPLELAEPDRMTVEQRESQDTAGQVDIEPEGRGPHDEEER
jgi:hypothetical protein